jgi:LPS O-antigen subunit length determinant protein (WzzB/FepE family)
VTFVNHSDSHFLQAICVSQTEEIELSAMNETLPSDEIDLLQLIETIWDGKWKIIAITAACVLGVFGFQLIGTAPNFVATTEIKPISSKEADAYAALNSLELLKIESKKADDDALQNSRKFYKITKENLLALFNERVTQPDTLTKLFKNLALLDRNAFDSEDEYDFALRALAGQVTLLPPVNVDGKERGEQRRNWTLKIEYNDVDKWLSTLKQLHDIATKEVMDINNRRFETLLRTQNLKRSFELEDISTQITNIMADYDRKTSDRLAFLSEQALIARKLGVPKNTIEAQTFSAQNGVVASFKTDAPLYLRGYEAIEKEIELISSRKDKRAFASGLLELEQKKRALEQDKTLQRAEALFAATPLTKPSEFSAASFAIAATQFEYKSKRALMLALAAVVGGMIGVVYVLIASAIRGRREAEAD